MHLDTITSSQGPWWNNASGYVRRRIPNHKVQYNLSETSVVFNGCYRGSRLQFEPQIPPSSMHNRPFGVPVLLTDKSYVWFNLGSDHQITGDAWFFQWWQSINHQSDAEGYFRRDLKLNLHLWFSSLQWTPAAAEGEAKFSSEVIVLRSLHLSQVTSAETAHQRDGRTFSPTSPAFVGRTPARTRYIWRPRRRLPSPAVAVNVRAAIPRSAAELWAKTWEGCC